MTREELIKVIYKSAEESTCPIHTCHELYGEDSCLKCAEKLLAEYEKQIYNKALEDFGKKMKEANSIALYYRDVVDLEKFMKCASDEIKEELMK